MEGIKEREKEEKVFYGQPAVDIFYNVGIKIEISSQLFATISTPQLFATISTQRFFVSKVSMMFLVSCKEINKNHS